jgi:DNA polymerase-3 subunit alpha
MGFYVSGHPLAKFASKLAELNSIDLAAVEGRRNGEEITVAGIIVTTRSMRSRKGERWGILTLQDMTGVLEVLAFPEAFARLEPVFKGNAPLVLKGRVNVEEAGSGIK